MAKLIARLKRFGHCLFHVVTFRLNHRMFDQYWHPAVPTRSLFGRKGQHTLMACECGKVFWALRGRYGDGGTG